MNSTIYLTACRERRHPVAHQFAQRFSFQTHQFGDQQPRDHAAVAVSEITEIVVGAHFATVDGVFLAHTFFNKGVSGFRHHRRAACSSHHINGVPGETWIMDDLRAGIFFEERFCQQTDNVVTLNKLPFFVKQETAVKIAIKGNAHIRAVFDDRIAGVVAAFRQQRIRNTVGEIAVRRVVHFDQFHGCAEGFKAGFDGVHHRTRRAVPGVNHQLERREVFDVDITEQVINVSVTQVDLLIATAFGFIDGRKVVGFSQTLDVAQSGITADRASPFAHQLHAVVIHRVMAGGNFDAAIHAEMERGEIDLFGAGHANIQHIDARIL
ncbi:hypothetical protein ESCOMM068B2_23815 [Escherichia coli]